MTGTITLKIRELAIFGFGLTIGAVVVIVVSTRASGSYLQAQRKNYNRRRKRVQQDEEGFVPCSTDSSIVFLDGYESSVGLTKAKAKFADSGGKFRPGVRMALRVESSLSQSLMDEFNDSDLSDSIQELEEMNTIQKRIHTLSKIHRKVINEHAVERQSVTVRVPATSANMGPGYDCLGMALNTWSEMTIERSESFEITFSGEGAGDIPLDETNLIVSGVRAAFESAGKDVPPLRIHCNSQIPYAKGMGSSSASIVGGLIGGLVLSGHRLPCWGSEELLQLACSIEGHPDNVAPAIYGGCQLGIFNGQRWQSERVQLPPGIQVILFVPDFTGETSSARDLLPESISRKDAAFTIGRVAWLINALATGNLENLTVGCQDAMHQPQRGKAMYTYLEPVVKAATEAGADAAYLSGAGPTIAAITSGASGDIFTQRATERVDQEVATAILEAANKLGVCGEVLITNPSETGAFVMKASPEFSDIFIAH